ncbi:DpnI domain-containing protein [Notoacmeibacter marinus]|uniref:DpnI domain-containing protein n=1 Tax=Notoacmeibacter marinus TaxID=1876515 RepID=UPI000DF2C006|nr:DpnI domain-containing protein [Notoacmeibacter marinus]
MKLGFEESQTPFESPSQSARDWTESWATKNLYCPECGNDTLIKFPPNQKLADFFCDHCSSQYELKSSKRRFGKKFVNGAYQTKIERLRSDTSPNFILLNYDFDRRQVSDVFFIPKRFFIPEIVEKRKPLRSTARRAGWVGSNIRLDRIPSFGRIFCVRNGIIVPKEQVRSKWKATAFLDGLSLEARGWLTEVLSCIEHIGTDEFSLADVYAFEGRLQSLYPNNQNIRPKIRQQLQFLRNAGILTFEGGGAYRLVK